MRNSIYYFVLGVAFITLCHIPYALKNLSIEHFDVCIATAMFIASNSLLGITRKISIVDKHYYNLRYIYVWAVTGSASNLIDEIFNVNTKHINYETIMFIVLLLVFLKREKNLIIYDKQNRGNI